MSARVRQGQSVATVDKERRIAAAMSVSMRIANRAFGGKGYRFWCFDANCGSGWNYEVGVPGSPLVFWHVAQACLTQMQPAAYFCDRDLVAIEQLRARFGHMPCAAGSILMPGDNEDGLMEFAAAIRRSERAKYAVGAVIIDPNGYFYRSAKGIGAPVKTLPWFVAEFPRIDIILNLNMRTFHLQRGAGHDVVPPTEVLGSLRKAHWLVARAGGQSRHLLAVGRNMPTGDHKALGLYDADSEIGRKLLDVDAVEDEDDGGLFAAGAVALTEYKQHALSAAFPGMSEDEFGELRADIAANGLHHPITLYEDEILDGWHRYCACDATGSDARFTVFEGTWRQAIAFVRSANVARRHLSPGERAMVAAAIANIPPNNAGNRRTSAAVSQAEAADLFGVAERSVSDAKAVLQSDDEVLKEEVKAGATSVKAAAKKARAAKKKAKGEKPRSTPQPRSHARSDNVTYLPNSSMQITVKQWEKASAEQRAMVLDYRNPKAVLNEQKRAEDMNLIDWARWSWNPIVGCLHDCPYCYARDIAERFQRDGVSVFANGFVPTLHPGRLSAPLNRAPLLSEDPRDARIFTGSMSDIFGRWVPAEWVEAILGVAAEARQWEFLMLTKFPKRMSEFEIPNNVWMGTTVDCQARVASAEAAFERVQARVKWLSCEPLLEPLKFKHLDRFQLLVIGGASRSSKTPRWIPPYEWLADLMRQADEAGCAVFLKSNLYRKESPGGPRYRFTDQLPRVFEYLGKAKGEGAA